MSGFSNVANIVEDGDIFVMREVTGRGNGLFANRDIEKDELIFKDQPLFRTFLRPSDNKKCYYCLKRLEDASENHEVQLINSPTFTCEIQKCGMKFCSLICFESMQARGHRWLCHHSTYAPGGIVDQLSTNDPRGHIMLAFTVYATVLEVIFQHEMVSQGIKDKLDGEASTIPIGSSPVEIFDSLMFSIQKEDYCRTTHAFRNGLNEVDEDMFSSLIAPAYFSSYLEAPLKLITEYFSSENGFARNLWLQEIGHLDRYDGQFLQSDLFMDNMILRKLIGAFVVNNLQIEMNTEKNGGSAPAVGSEEDISTNSIIGSGLYKLYSKLNHSCLSNIRNEMGGGGSSGGDQEDDMKFAEVRVYATRKIEKGEEITTSYLHLENAPTCSISRKARHVLLRQYMFSCTCDLCTQEGGQPPDSESDDDY